MPVEPPGPPAPTPPPPPEPPGGGGSTGGGGGAPPNAYLVQSLINLRAEIDNRWPLRSRAVDGWYRSPSVGISYGHNPDSKGAVHAIDVDKNGIDPYWIIANFYHAAPVYWYVIYNRQIWSNTYGFRPLPYNGVNPHTDHMHFEVYHTAAGENYTGPWNIAFGPEPVGTEPPVSTTAWGAADPLPDMNAASGMLIQAGTTLLQYSDAIAHIRSL
jgi:hypothetical protein